MAEPKWLTEARKHLGQREVAGTRHNPRILRWWTQIRAPFTDDETPWCAGFVGAMLESVGIRSSRSAAARSYLKWGRKLREPRLGCIVVFERGPRNGHVGFFVGWRGKDLMILGGNQGNAVNIKPFPASRVLGYRWPDGEPMAPEYKAPKVESDDPVSQVEAFHSPPDVEPVDDDRPKKTGVSEGTAIATGGGIAGTAWTIWEHIQQAPETLLQAIVGAASKPQFWAFVVGAGIAGGLFYLRWRVKKNRRCT